VWERRNDDVETSFLFGLQNNAISQGHVSHTMFF
jgi:hypothetical protein